MTKMIHNTNQDLENYIQQMQSHGQETITNKEFNKIDQWDTQHMSRRDLRNWKRYRKTQYKPVDAA